LLCTVELCDGSKKVIGEAKVTPFEKAYNKKQKALLKIDEPGTYYIHISNFQWNHYNPWEYELIMSQMRYAYV